MIETDFWRSLNELPFIHTFAAGFGKLMMGLVWVSFFTLISCEVLLCGVFELCLVWLLSSRSTVLIWDFNFSSIIVDSIWVDENDAGPVFCDLPTTAILLLCDFPLSSPVFLYSNDLFGSNKLCSLSCNVGFKAKIARCFLMNSCFLYWSIDSLA